MKFRRLALSAAFVAATLSSGLATSVAMAQGAVQFFPSLTGRTGPVAPNAAPFANGYWDYMKLVNERGGIPSVVGDRRSQPSALRSDRYRGKGYDLSGFWQTKRLLP